MDVRQVLRLLYTEDHLQWQQYSRLTEFAESEGILPQVYTLLHQSEKFNELPGFARKALKQSYKKNMFLLKWLSIESQKVVKRLSDEEIKVIPLKGGFFAERYFGDACARATSDLDLLILPQDIEKTSALLQSSGFLKNEEEIDGHFHTSFYRPVKGSTIPFSVEVHWGFMRGDTTGIDMENIWENAMQSTLPYMYQLSDEDTFYFTCLHGWRHNLDSPKYFIDLIQVLQEAKEPVDFQQLLERAERERTYKRITFVLNHLVNETPFLFEVGILESLTIKQKLYPHDTYRAFIQYQFFSYDHPKHTLNELKRWLIPNQTDLNMELEYKAASYLKGIRKLYQKRLTGVLK
ncbi:nucleotidyltransferase family protein [Jeotgalibacillus malaysiensis]|uniref:nucleotidyltransferase family protein n=1 Tax=Jeotgalibacillus malaysiensis TaxID=1508404 RepID=UPI00384D2ABB